MRFANSILQWTWQFLTELALALSNKDIHTDCPELDINRTGFFLSENPIPS
jgi:hypothetical protein